MLRYLIALAIAAIIIVAGIVLVRTTLLEIEADFEQHRQQLKAQKANGTLPDAWQDVDLDKIKYTDVGMKVSESLQIRLDLSMWLQDFWFVFDAFVVVVCLGGAFVWGRIFARRRK